MPATGKVTCVVCAPGALMVTGKGPLSCTHCRASVPFGNPSSVTLAVNVAVFEGRKTLSGKVRLLIAGARLIGGVTRAMKSGRGGGCGSVPGRTVSGKPGGGGGGVLWGGGGGRGDAG